MSAPTGSPAAPRRNWGGNLEYGAQSVAAPRSLAELRAVLLGADRLRPLGSRHSFNGIADTQGVQLSLEAMPIEPELDTAGRTVRVGAGSSYGSLAQTLHRGGWALSNLASLPHISVAGATQTGTHGSGAGNPSLAQAVVGLELVGADGELRRLDAGDPLLDAHRVGLGALGVITALDLAIEPAFEVEQRVHLGLPWDAVEQHFEAIMRSAYSVSMFTVFAAEGVRQVWRKRRVGVPITGPDLAELGAVEASAAVHPVPGGETAAVTEQAGRPGPWHERLPHFRLGFAPSAGAEIQCEYLLPAAEAVPAIRVLRELGDRIAPVLHIAELRRVAADTAWLAPSAAQDSVAFHFTFRLDPRGVEALLPSIDAALAPFAARPHWGKVSAASPERLHAVFPRLAEFAALVRELDPHGRLRNAFLDRVLGPA